MERHISSTQAYEAAEDVGRNPSGLGGHGYAHTNYSTTIMEIGAPAATLQGSLEDVCVIQFSDPALETSLAGSTFLERASWLVPRRLA